MKYLIFLLLTLCCISSNIQVCFNPQEDCLPLIIHELQNAKKSIYCTIYIITLDELAHELKKADLRGIDVKILLETSLANTRWSKYPTIKHIAKLDNNQHKMHRKSCVIDGKTIITGSSNWSFSGMYRNNEEIIIIKSPSLAKQYEAEFERLWESG